MNRLRRWSALALVFLPAAWLLSASGEGLSREKEQKPPAKAAEKWLVDRALTVSAATEPVPALRYRLFPTSVERKEGNAVPMYLRFAHERNDAWKKELREKPPEWNKLPLNKLPLAEAKKFLAGHSYNLRQLDLGARRKTANWNYSFDAGDPISILLPDVQEMRAQGPLLILQARVQMEEGEYAQAVRTLETAFSFSRQISEAPLLINGLVAIAVASQTADALPDLIERAGSPNLYWALAVLPRPLIDLRKADEMEQQFLVMQIPDLADVDKSRAASEWAAALKRIRVERDRIRRLERDTEAPPAGTAPDDPADKSPDLAAARKYLIEVVRLDKKRVEKMPAAEALVRYMAKLNRELSDEITKGTYLPFAEARPVLAAADKRIKEVANTEGARLVRLFLAATQKVRLAQVRLERKLTILRAIEALRMHVAKVGKLPDRLDQVTVVPVPPDPGTGKAFEYERKGQTAILISRIAGEPLEVTGLRYRITLR